ncbi:MAG: hypothetical protein KKF62_13050 [Bacteroidetes bacterium]|nr:hypothetical protein [Bacteroidota bacterium]MBU1115914.1 hypothetical protein [Bacteroidota bacterium]MBU1798727.1 hypothetical protein [Bacteroidota bacterium]
MKGYLVKNLANGIFEFSDFIEAENHFNSFPNSTEIIKKDENGNEKIIHSRTHNEVGIIEINNKCVYLKVPFYQPSDKPEIKISKIGETPEKLRSKMEVIDEKWNEIS